MAPLSKSPSIDHFIFSLITNLIEKYRPNCVANKYSIIFNVEVGVDKYTHYFDRYIYIYILRERKYFYLYVLLNCIKIVIQILLQFIFTVAFKMI
jgi:hypothetical protein